MNTFFAICSNASDLVCRDSLPNAQASSGTLRAIFLVAFSIIGSLAFLFIVIGGVRYVLSKGEPDNVQRAKNEIKYAVTGLIITALAAAIVNFVLDRLQQKP